MLVVPTSSPKKLPFKGIRQESQTTEPCPGMFLLESPGDAKRAPGPPLAQIPQWLKGTCGKIQGSLLSK